MSTEKTSGLFDGIYRGRLLRFGYEQAVAWYRQEGTKEAHDAVLMWWRKWADYAKQQSELSRVPL